MARQTNYNRGYYAESKAVKELEAEGFVAVRTAGSHSPWDVIGIKEDEVRLVQVKRCKEPGDAAAIIKKAISELASIEIPVAAFQEVWTWVDSVGFTKRAVPWRGQ